MPRSLRSIAQDIKDDWDNIDTYAIPYVDAMLQINGGLECMYGADDAEDIVIRFLCNAQKWRGQVAREVKAELRDMLKQHKS